MLGPSLTLPAVAARRGGGAASAPALADQAATFGALTLAGAGGFRPLTAGGTEIELAAVTDQAGAVNVWSISGGYLVADAPPAGDDALVLTCSRADGGPAVEITISLVADAYSTRGATELDAALDDIGTGGGRSVLMRPGTVAATNALFTNRAFTSRVVVRGTKHGANWLTTFTTTSTAYLDINNGDRIEVADLALRVADNGDFGFYAIRVRGGSVDPIFTDLDIQGAYRDPFGDYAASGAYTNVNFLMHIADCTNPIVRRCKVWHGSNGINFSTGVTGDLLCEGNDIQFVYSDGIKVSGDAALRATGSVTLRRNLIGNPTGLASDALNPHADAIQFQFTASDADDYNGITIEANEIVQGASRGSFAAGVLMSFAGGWTGYVAGIKVLGNNFCINNANAFVMSRGKDGLFVGNTMVRNRNRPEGFAPRISFGGAAHAGTTVMRHNVTENGIASIAGGTLIEEDNVHLGGLPSAADYEAAFVNPDPALLSTAAGIRAAYAMKPGGTLAAALAGCYGTGYIVHGAIRGDGSDYVFDRSFENLFATELTLAPFATGPGGAAPIFSGRREQNSGLVFVSGTGQPGAVVQGRMVRASDGVAVSAWTDIATATGGVFEGYIEGAPRGFDALKAQVRYRDASNAPAETSNTCFVGWVLAYWAQSEQRWMGDTNTQDTSVSPIAATPGISVRVVTLDRAPVDMERTEPAPVTAAELLVFDVTGDSPTGRQPVWAFANAAAEMFDDGPIIFMGHQVSGSNDMQTVDDSNFTHRVWSDELLIAAAGQPHLVETTRPVVADAVMWGFSSAAAYTSETSALGITGRIAFGLTPAGDPVAPGTEINLFGNGTFAYTQNHSWAEIYDWAGGARLAFRQSPIIDVMNAQEAFNGHPVYGPWVIGFPTAFSQYWITNGTRGGDGVWFDLGHPSTNQHGGNSHIARMVAASLARATGAVDFGPFEWSWAEWPTAPEADKRYVYLGVNGADVTTIRREIAPATIGGAAVFGEGSGGLRINGAPAQNATIVSRGGFDRVRLAKPGDADWTPADVLSQDMPAFGTGDLVGTGMTEDQRRDTLSRYQDFPLVPTGLASLPGVPVGYRPAAGILANQIPAPAVGVALVLQTLFDADPDMAVGEPRVAASVTGHDGSPLAIFVGAQSTTSVGTRTPSAATLGANDLEPQKAENAIAAFALSVYTINEPGTGDLDLTLTYPVLTRGVHVAIFKVTGGTFGSPVTAQAIAGNLVPQATTVMQSPENGSLELSAVISGGPAGLGGAGAWLTPDSVFPGFHHFRTAAVENVPAGQASGAVFTFSPNQRVVVGSVAVRPSA